jgi:tetratricopeptide (TPR) repeat protein
MKKIAAFLIFIASLDAFAQDTRGIGTKSTGVEEGNTYAIVIGISTYKDVNPLKYAHQDAEVFANFLLSRDGMALDPVNVKLFLNEKATLANIGSSLSDLMGKNLKKGDRIIFFFAGHGDYDANILKDQALLLLYGAPKQNYFQNIFSGDFISTSDLNSRFIDPLAARGCEVMLIVDACHATGMNKNLSGGAEGGKITSMALQSMTSPIKIYSCQANELSLESQQWGGGRGLFSYVLMEGLYGMADADNNKTVTLRELGRYLEDHVATLAAPNKQEPIVKMEDPTRVISKVNEGFLASYKSQKDKGLVFIAKADTKGSMDVQLQKMDSSQSQLYLETDSLIDKNELEKAYEKFLEIEKSDKESDASLQLRRNLSAALQHSAAELLLPMLEDVSRASSNIPAIQKARHDLERAAHLLGEKHFLYKNLQARLLFLKAYIYSLERGIRTIVSGDTRYVVGDDSLALTWLNESVRLEPNAPYTWYYIGFFNRVLGKYELAKEYIEKYLNLIPHSSVAHGRMGAILANLKRNDEALVHLQKALALDPKNTFAMNDLGLVYTRLGRKEEALAIYLKAVETDPMFFVGYYNICCYYSLAGNHEKALYYLRKSFETGKLNNLKLLQNDTDLDPIRTTKEFKDLLEEFLKAEDLAKYPDMYIVRKK